MINNMKYSIIGISLPNEVILQIDLYRGDIPRSKYILRAIQQKLPELTSEGKEA
jgi:hypothetical protein